MNRSSFVNRNRLSWWFPRIPLRIAAPETRLVMYEGRDSLVALLDGKVPDGFYKLRTGLIEMGDTLGWPIFLRTDYLSGKHDWKDTCYVAGRDDISQHIELLVEHSFMADMETFPTDIWVVRKMIPTSPAFMAFPGQMPIVKERRYFVQDGKVVCHHPYWPEDVFNDQQYKMFRKPRTSCRDWRERLSEMNEETRHEIRLLSKLSSIVGTAIGGEWSIDWLWSESYGQWYLIDMAEAKDSYHWSGCRYAL